MVTAVAILKPLVINGDYDSQDAVGDLHAEPEPERENLVLALAELNLGLRDRL